MTISHITLLSVPVTDQDRAVEFYVGVLGLDLIADNHMGPAQRWVQVAPKGATTTITLVTWFEAMPAGSLKGLVLESDDIDADVAALEARGLTFPDGIQEMPWGRYVTLNDPDGNGIVLQTTSRTFARA
jgi:predicted enzyme related to lactoylglutathione lyase